MAEDPSPQVQAVPEGYRWQAAGFYRPLLDWPERQEVAKLTMPRMIYMGDRDHGQGLGDRWQTSLSDLVRHAQPELEHVGWTVHWLPGHEHMTANAADVAMPVVRDFFRRAFSERTGDDAR